MLSEMWFMENQWVDRSAVRIFEKSFREQSKLLCIKAFWVMLLSLVKKNRYRDGFVEWGQVQSAVEDILDALTREYGVVDYGNRTD